MKITELNPLMQKRAERMIHDMSGIGSVDVREEIACELVRNGYMKVAPEISKGRVMLMSLPDKE